MALPKIEKMISSYLNNVEPQAAATERPRMTGVVGKEERGELDMRREDRKGKDERERRGETEGEVRKEKRRRRGNKGADRGRSSKGEEKEEGNHGGGPR